MTVEEIEIQVTASVEEALKEFKKMLPEIKRQMKQIQSEVNNVDFKEITQNIDFNEVKKEVERGKKLIKEAFEPNEVSFTINGLDETKKDLKEVNNEISKTKQNTSGGFIDYSKYQGSDLLDRQSNETKNVTTNTEPSQKSMSMWDILKAKIEQVKPAIQEFKEIISEAYERVYGNKNISLFDGENSNKQLELVKYKISEIEEKLEKAKNGTIHLNYKEIIQAEAELERLNQKKEKLANSSGSSNIFSNMFSSIKKATPQLNGWPNITAKINANIKQMSSGVKQGLGHILKYAGALFSMRGIYSLLSGSAQSWLSSQLAPVIQYVTNLMYQLLKAVQSVVYALFRVNIFANASSKSYGAMAGSAKKAKEETKQLAGVHDEINNIQSNENSDSGSGSGSASPSFDLSNVDPSSSIMDAIANGDWHGVGVLLGQKLNEAMASIPWDKIQNTAREIGKNTALLLNGFIETVDWYQVGNTFAQGLNTAIYFAYEFVTTFNWKQFGIAIANAVNGFFDNVDWGALAQTLSTGLKGVFDTATGFFTTLDWGIIVDSIITFFQNVDYSGISDAFFEMLGSAAASLVNLGMVIGEYINQAIDSAKEYFQQKIEECGGNVVEGILKGILDALISIGDWVREHIFTPFINGFKEAFGIHSPSTVMAEMGGYIIEDLKNGITAVIDKITEIWNNMKETAITIFNNVKDKLSEIWENIKEKASSIWNNLKDFLGTTWNNIKTTASTMFTNIKDNIVERFTNIKAKAHDIWNNIKTTITDKITNVKTNISNTLNNIKTVWSSSWNSMKNTVTNIFNGIWSSIKGTINSILGGIESMANGIVNGINTVVNSLNSLSFQIPDWVPGYGGKSWGMSIPTMGTVSLPRLATGNVAYEETLAIFGEYAGASSNPEITAPQNIIRETVEDALRNAGGSNQPINLSVYVSDRKLGQILLEDLRSMKRQTGKDIEAIVGG